jgi:hypothetical protein
MPQFTRKGEAADVQQLKLRDVPSRERLAATADIANLRKGKNCGISP